MNLKVITPPAVEPITLADAKARMKIDDTTDDGTLKSLITQAREECEDWQKKKYITQVLEGYIDHFCHEIEFRDCSPVQSVTSIKYTDSGGTEHTVDPAIYELDDVSFVNQMRLRYGQMWPTAVLKTVNPIAIRFIAGYPDKTITGETLGTGDDAEHTYTLSKSPLKSVDKVYFGGVETGDYTYDLETATITCTPAKDVVVTVDYTIHDVPETVKQAIVIKMKLAYETYTDDDQKRYERAWKSLLGMRRVMSV